MDEQNINQENTSQENSNQVNTSQENTSQENTRQVNAGQENSSQQNINQMNSNGQNSNQQNANRFNSDLQDSSQQNVNWQNVNQQNLYQQISNQQNVNQQNMNQQNLNQQISNQQNLNQQNLNQQIPNQQNVNQQNVNQQYFSQQNSNPQNMATYNLDPYSNGLYGLPPEDIQPKKVLSQVGFALFVMATVVLLAQILIEVVVANYYPSISDASWYTWVMTAIVVVGIGFPTFYFLIRRVPDSRMGEEVKLKPTHFIVLFFICTAAMYITNFFSVILTTLIALLKGDDIFDLNPLMDAITGSNFILTLLYASIVAPIVEEIIFRKLLLNKLRRFGDVPAILLTAFAFGLFHLNLSQFFYATALGMIFAYIAVRTNTIKYTILLHIMINFIGTVVAPLSASGNFVFGLVLVVWVMTAIALGSVFFVLNVKKIKLEKTVPLVKRSDYFSNTGTILYALMCIIMIIIVTIS